MFLLRSSIPIRGALGLLRPAAVGALPLAAAQEARPFASKPDLKAIKDLREKSGAPMMDVKKALAECDGDMEKAYEALRKRGLAAATKKASRTAAEGLVGVASAPGMAAIVEINSETDFVSRNDKFQAMIGKVAAAALELPGGAGSEIPLADLEAAKVDGESVADAVVGVAGVVRENIKLRRGFKVAAPQGVVASYIHTGLGPGIGRIACLIALEAEGGCSGEAVQALGHKIAMHVVALRPPYLSREDVPADALEKERALLKEQAMASGKPEAIVDKMVMGRLSKFYEEFCLLEQKYVMDDSMTVQKVVEAAGKELGLQGLKVTSFVRVQVGEGIEVEESDFAAEVQSLSGGGK